MIIYDPGRAVVLVQKESITVNSAVNVGWANQPIYIIRPNCQKWQEKLFL